MPSAAAPVMRLRSDPYVEASAGITTWSMVVRLARAVGAALRLGWRADRRAVVVWLLSQVLAASAFAAALAATGRLLQVLLPARGREPVLDGEGLRAVAPGGAVLAGVLVVRYTLNAVA
ncbi:hypothetical protein ACIQB5_50045 [Streptomyces sp. NPDC088560]|uniref:hypothetical protein n=1 Tax=Streptomyces sp. NPDC088560 TaxID=3365868 RepID=UPI00381860FB